MSLLRWTKLGNQQKNSSEQALCRLVEEGILTTAHAFLAGADDGLGGDFCVSLRFRLGGKLAGALVFVHVTTDEVHHVEAVGTGGIAQIQHTHLIAILVTGDCTVHSLQVPLRIAAEEAGAAGTGILNVGDEEISSLADARCTNHEDMDIAGIHQR